MPPSLNSVPRPSTTIVEKPLEVTTRTGISTGKRSQRRVLGADCMIDHYDREIVCPHITKVNVRALPIATMPLQDFRSISLAGTTGATPYGHRLACDVISLFPANASTHFP